jgi:hypothetical protein
VKSGHVRRAIIDLAVAGTACLASAAPAAAQTCPDPAALTMDLQPPLAAVRYLADDALGGRRAGTPGEQCAAEFIASRFRRIGLRPAGENETYFQSLSLASAVNPHAPGGTGRNVLGALPGRDLERRAEWIVIGAHYDHLGTGGFGSLAPNETAVHNGADDNASGVAAMLRAAELLAGGEAPARSVLFAAFTGEESGLLGSAHFMSNPTLASGRIVAMINLDMVGRLGDGALIVSGVDTAEEWQSLLDPAAARAGVKLATRGEGFGPSDHTSFYLKDVPVLHVFTNTHGDYHKPSDDWQKVDARGLETIARLVADVAGAAANRTDRLTLVRGAGRPPPAPGDVGGYGAYLGTVPDFTPVPRGVMLSGVSSGSPAERGGLRAGDVIIGIGAHDVADLQGMTDALRAHRPGDTVAVRFLRGSETITIQVTLGDRAAR